MSPEQDPNIVEATAETPGADAVEADADAQASEEDGDASDSEDEADAESEGGENLVTKADGQVWPADHPEAFTEVMATESTTN